MPRLLLVGWEGADWKLLHAMIDAGALPSLRRLVEHGISGELVSLPPARSPIGWATLASGRSPARHGVTASVERRPDGGGTNPTGRRSWRAPSLWELVTTAGLRAAVVNWPATNPADRWPGVTMVDDSFASALGARQHDWPLPPHAVSPATLRAQLRPLRVHPSEIAPDAVAALFPQQAPPDDDDPGVAKAPIMLAQISTVHAATTWVAEHAEWDLLAVVYSLTRELRRAGLSQAQPGALQLQDMMLGRLMELSGDETNILLVSPQGDGGRGVLAGAGPRLMSDIILHGAASLDIVPTALALLGLEPPVALEGRVLHEAMVPQSAQRRSLPLLLAAPSDAAVPTEHLDALGYDPPVSDAGKRAIAAAAQEARLTLAEASYAIGAYAEAATHLREALQYQPDDFALLVLCARALMLADEWTACEPIAVTLTERFPQTPWGDLLHGVILALQQQPDQAASHLARAEQLGGDNAQVQLVLGLLAQRQGNAALAVTHLRRALSGQPELLEALIPLATAQHEQGDHAGAEVTLRNAIGLRFHLPLAHLQLGRLFAEEGRATDAARAFRTALRQRPGYAEAAAGLRDLERVFGRQ